MKSQILFSITLLLLSTFSCEKKVITPDNEIVSVNNGTVLGNINIGDFKHEVEIKQNTSNYKIQNRNGDDLKVCTDTESAAEWNALLGSINFENFKKLPAIDCQNCPALGDIGYEYLEITKGTDSYKIQFATGSDVTEVSDLLKIVREKRANLDKTCQK